MTSLPSKVPFALRNNAYFLSAYDICLRQEQSLQESIDKGEAVGQDMIYIRILGYLIHYVPTSAGLKKVTDEISSCQCPDSPLDVAALLKLGKMYYDHYIRAFRANKGRTPTPSNDSSPPSFDKIADAIKATLVEAPQSHADAKQDALIRDGYRCVVTGKYDLNSALRIKELKDIVSADPSVGIEPTQCAHIFAESTNSSIEPGTSKRENAATIWAVMNGFGHEKLPDELNGSKVHRLENVMTVAPGFLMTFDQLKIWFVATQDENKYELEAAEDFLLYGYPKYVTFTTLDPVKLPVPSPTYLAIHAACAKVAHLSGAAECIDRFYQDMDVSETLNPTGASAEMLEHAIFELQASGHEIIACD